MTPNSSNRVHLRCDYKPLPIQVSSLNLNFILDEITTVHAKMELGLAPNHSLDEIRRDGLYLDGRNDMKLISLRINGNNLNAENDYTLSESGIKLHGETLATAFSQPVEGSGGFSMTLESTVEIHPRENTRLEGLYLSGGNFCTQCEAEGFRGITYFFDRPDILTRYTTRLEADSKTYPVLLSNGNPVSEGVVGGNPARHYAIWFDPFPKPSYLFALVAGQLLFQEDTFVTKSGKSVWLRIYTQPKNISRVDHAMASLKKAMLWDEDTFGREYDLDRFNIVAVDDFNMGAMENKSLNIFNSRAVLATGETATDAEFQRIEGIVAHEYFHNWTGNRVTCRDWFQLTLKEGLTVYRDQEFSSDMHSRDVYRLGVVSMVRSVQFPQDQGPLAHPIRPDTYEKIDNFYTITVYRKGAEIIRIYETVLGKAGFRKGMDLYFERHDGQAVTCEDFRKAMEDANGVDLSVLGRWYSQPGTPVVQIETEHKMSEGRLALRIRQHTPQTKGYPEPQPVLIPIRLSLLRKSDGSQIPLSLHSSSVQSACRWSKGRNECEVVLHLEQAEQCFEFEGIPSEACILSVMRGFSAPVVYTVQGESPETWLFLLKHDDDGFIRYESAQRLVSHCLRGLYQALVAYEGEHPINFETIVPTELKPIVAQLVEAYKCLLLDTKTDIHLKSYLLSFPTNAEQILQIPQCKPPLLHTAKRMLRSHVAKQLSAEIWSALKLLNSDSTSSGGYVFTSSEVARRSITNTMYSLLSAVPSDTNEPENIETLLLERQRTASNMTDEVACMYALNARVEPSSKNAREQSLQMFYEKWKSDDLVLIHWFTANAVSEALNNVTTLKSIMEQSEFSIKNPNKCYALFGAFAESTVNFHNIDGSGYAFMADAVLAVDAVNHQVAAKLALSFNIQKQLDTERQELIFKQLHRISSCTTLSPNVREVVSKNLNARQE